MEQQTVTLIVAGLGIGGTFGGVMVGHFLTRSWQREQWRLDHRREEYRELLGTITSAYMRIISAYESTVPVVDEELKRHIREAKNESFQVLQDRIAIAWELEDTDVLDVWTEAILGLETNGDSIKVAKKFRPMREKITLMANRPAPKRHRLRDLYHRIRYFREIREFKNRRGL
jgi:hypothetical protein